jgi:hypothetical protein
MRRFPHAQEAVELVASTLILGGPPVAHFEGARPCLHDDAARVAQGADEILDEVGVADFDFHCRIAPRSGRNGVAYLTVVNFVAASSPHGKKAKEARCGHTRPSFASLTLGFIRPAASPVQGVRLTHAAALARVAGR